MSDLARYRQLRFHIADWRKTTLSRCIHMWWPPAHRRTTPYEDCLNGREMGKPNAQT
jgi:hypothetical protein